LGSPDLARDLIDEFDRAVDQIAEPPGSGAPEVCSAATVDIADHGSATQPQSCTRGTCALPTLPQSYLSSDVRLVRCGAPLIRPEYPSRSPSTSKPRSVMSYSRYSLLCWLPRIFTTATTLRRCRSTST